jgi:hypothetical protein
MLNRDGLNNAPIEEVAEASFVLLDKLQLMQPHMQAASTAMLFLLVCEKHQTPPQDIFVAVKNMMASREAGENPHYSALKLYIDNELRA